MTDTSANIGGLDVRNHIKRAVEIVLFFTPMCAQHHSTWTARVVTTYCHISNEWKKTLGTHRATWLSSVKPADEDRKYKRSEGEKKQVVEHVASWKMNKPESQQREPRGSYGSGRQISSFPPVADYTEYTQWETGIWQRLTFSSLIIRRHIGSLQEERR